MLEADERPWEEPGCFRLDYESHRSKLLLNMGNTCMVCGALALYICAPALIGLPLGIAVIMMANKDIDRMDAGHVDPSGKELALMACIRAKYGILLCAISWIPTLGLFCVISRGLL
jgi:hypothetical protein